jgi:hypothetical protein
LPAANRAKLSITWSGPAVKQMNAWSLKVKGLIWFKGNLNFKRSLNHEETA